MVPEHTWGLDTMVQLTDVATWRKRDSPEHGRSRAGNASTRRGTSSARTSTRRSPPFPPKRAPLPPLGSRR